MWAARIAIVAALLLSAQSAHAQFDFPPRASLRVQLAGTVQPASGINFDSSFTGVLSGGTLTLSVASLAGTYCALVGCTMSGAIDSAAVLNLGTLTATGVNLGRAGQTNALVGPTTITDSNAQITVNNATGLTLKYVSTNTTFGVGSTTYSMFPAGADGSYGGSGAILAINNSNALTTTGQEVVAIQNGTGAGEEAIGLVSGQQRWFGDGLVVTADTGGITANEVVVWSGAKKAQNAAATVNLTTIAGVASQTAASGNTSRVVTRGFVLVNADAGITAGQLVGTSGTTAGNVQSGTAPGAGAIVGRAIEATGATIAGKVTVELMVN